METTIQKKAGKSFQAKSKYSYYSNPEQSLKLGTVTVTSSAQAMTAIAYGDSHIKIPFRNLSFRTKCEDYADWRKCIELIKSYNEFDSEIILKAAWKRLNLQKYLNENNGNNGNSIFDFEIAREGSPAFYVTWNSYFNNKIIKDYEIVKDENGEEIGKDLFWEEYTEDDFRDSMKELSKLIGADEFTIEEQEYGDMKTFEARFWFD